MSLPAVSSFSFFQESDSFVEYASFASGKVFLADGILERLKSEGQAKIQPQHEVSDNAMPAPSYHLDANKLAPKTKEVWIAETGPLAERAIALQKWEGFVLEVGESTFRARLKNLSTPGYDEEVEFPFDDLMSEDVPLVERGAPFYWSIGRRFGKTGQMTRYSFIRFKRLPRWEKQDLSIPSEVQQIREALDW